MAVRELVQVAPFMLFRISFKIILRVIFILPFLVHELKPQGAPQMLPLDISVNRKAYPTSIFERNAVNYLPIKATDISEKS